MVIHAFGAYFGLAVARCLFKRGHIDNPAEGGEYHSDIFSLVGTVFLWMFWPSFNSMPGSDEDPGRYLAVMNTYLALCGACMMTYATSMWATPHRRITMEHVQNATLAGVRILLEQDTCATRHLRNEKRVIKKNPLYASVS